MTDATAKKRQHVAIGFESTAPAQAHSSPASTKLAAAAPIPLREVAIFPAPGDNCAICTKKVPAGTVVTIGDVVFTIGTTVMEGHRICAVVQGIREGEALLSWGLPFGYALRKIELGEYVCNASVLYHLKDRRLDFELPHAPNFEDRLESIKIDSSTFKVGNQVEIIDDPAALFEGYNRGTRGVGTRNFIVILGLTSRTGSFARFLEQNIKTKIDITKYSNISGVVAIQHTEGGTHTTPLNNIELLHRTMAGFIVHPNVGAILVVDDAAESDKKDGSVAEFNQQSVLKFMVDNKYPIDQVIHKFFTLSNNFKADIDSGVQSVQNWLTEVNNFQRTHCNLSTLKLALQCGGSDAFSGVSANPLAGWAAMQLIKHGGSVNLAETDELMGAEPYIVRNTRNMEVALSFLEKIEWYKTYAAWHGHSAEANPSGGNKYRGLYNIALKSLGAAMKKNPNVSLDHVIDYAELMRKPGYHFMNSPGNDLESIAGQVASGATMIYFTTGNGSVTNFPFVPTIKLVTTSSRFKLLEHDMDVNAGRYIDGMSMEDLGTELYVLTKKVASGQRSVGEKAGHSQVSIWRNWAQTDKSKLENLSQRPQALDGESLVVKRESTSADTDPFAMVNFKGLKTNDGRSTTDSVGLILPTSICSGQIARLIAEKMNEWLANKKTELGLAPDAIYGVSRFVALPHTEGCGSSPGIGEQMYGRVVIGHLLAPTVRHGLLLEHGCEKTHNDYMSVLLRSMNVPLDRFGWASVQLDGGIDKVTKKVQEWFFERIQAETTPTPVTESVSKLRVAFLTAPNVAVSPVLAKQIGLVASSLVLGGGMVVVPSHSGLLESHQFLKALDDATPISTPVRPTIAYAQRPKNQDGFHVMQTLTDHWIENLTAVAGTGVELLVLFVEQDQHVTRTLQSHPMLPLVQITTKFSGSTQKMAAQVLQDFDLVLGDESDQWGTEIVKTIARAASREFVPKMTDNCDFQVARDILSISV